MLNFDLHLKGFYTPKRGGIDESFLWRDREGEIGRERERMQENAERQKERKVYSKVVRKWLGKRSVVFS